MPSKETVHRCVCFFKPPTIWQCLCDWCTAPIYSSPLLCSCLYSDYFLRATVAMTMRTNEKSSNFLGPFLWQSSATTFFRKDQMHADRSFNSRKLF